MPDKFGWDNNFGNSPAPSRRRDGHSKIVYDKETRSLKTVDPHPETAIADAMNVLLLVEHGCSEEWAKHFVGNWNAKCEELAEARNQLVKANGLLRMMLTDPERTLAREPDTDGEVIFKFRRMVCDHLGLPYGSQALTDEEPA